MLFGGATVPCNSGIVSLLTPLEQANTGLAATHKLISSTGTQLFLRNTGSPQLSSQQFLGQFHSLTGPISVINTAQGPTNLMTVTGVLPAGSPGCLEPGQPAPATATPAPQQDNSLLLLLLLSGALGGGGSSNLSQLLPLLLLSGGGSGAI